MLTLDGQETYKIVSGDVVTVKRSKIRQCWFFLPTAAMVKFCVPSSVGVIYLRESEKRKMLNELSIKNFAIIDELHVSFGNGLNIISGETGAGKSIIIGAVSLLLGDRATTEIIRAQADTATVEAVFDISANKQMRDKIADMGFPDEEDLIIRRIISRTGKNRAFINGQTATLANLASVSENLINICGQREHQVILNAENHVNILDEFGGCLPDRLDYEVIYNQYRNIRTQIEKLHDLSKSREEKTDLLKFQLKEIQDINPQPAEDTTLADEKKFWLIFKNCPAGLIAHTIYCMEKRILSLLN